MSLFKFLVVGGGGGTAIIHLLLQLLLISNANIIGASKISHRISNRYVYIDLGANNGESVESFLPSENKAGKKVARDGSSSSADNLFFKKANNNSNPMYHKRNYEIHAIEANPHYTEQLLRQQRKYEDKNVSKSYTLYNGTGISTMNGEGYLILDCHGCKNGSSGSTMKRESKSAVGVKVPIRLLDIATLFRKLKIRHDDFVFLKIDIEGFEYDIVRRLLVTGILEHLVDKIAVEWHHDNLYVFGAPHNKSQSNYKERVDIHEKYVKMYESIRWFCAENENLQMKFISWGR